MCLVVDIYFVTVLVFFFNLIKPKFSFKTNEQKVVEWEVERMMVNGRSDGGDSEEKTVGSLGKVWTRKRCRRGEVGTIARKREKE